MGKVTLAGAMPPDNNNGLAICADQMIDDYKPGDEPRLYNIVARVSVREIKIKTEQGGVMYPVLAVKHWELVPAEHQEAFGRIIGDAYGGRTGILELPFPAGTVPLKDAEDPFPEEDDPDAGDGPADLAAHRARGRS
jgi:hypothetical protein